MQNFHEPIRAKGWTIQSAFIGIFIFILWANVTANSEPPAAPGNLAATVLSTSRINLTWTDNSTDEAGFIIKRKVLAAGVYTDLATVGPGVTSYSNIGLNANTTYYYVVCAYNAVGDSAGSNEVRALTFMDGPSRLTAKAVSISRINLTWLDNTVNEAGFKIERKTGVSGVYAEIALAERDVTTYSDSGLAANSQYFYRLYAYNPLNISGYSNEANATTGTADSLNAPNNLTAMSIGRSQINLAWSDNSSNETGFMIERKTGPDAYAEIAVVGANAVAYIDSGLITHRRYFYRVRAYNATGHSTYSNEAYATTWIKEPSDLTATAMSDSRIDLAWLDNSTNETSFRIERKTGADGIFALIGTAAQNATSFSDSGLSVNTPYFYRMRAVNATNVSDYSNEAGATTLLRSAIDDMNRGARPEEIFLAQNYPNPFGRSPLSVIAMTTISYTLPQGMKVSLKIVNVAGQEVATLAKGYQQRGAYRVSFEAKSLLPTGVYFAVLQAGAVTQVRRMVYAK